MARQDERRRNNRKQVDTTRKITRPVTKTNTRTITSYEKDRLTASGGTQKAFSNRAGIDYKSNPHGHGEVYGFLDRVENGQVQYGDTVGYSVNRGGADWEYYDTEGRQLHFSGKGDRAGNEFTRYIEKNEEQKYTTTEYKTETRGSSRLQALDKRSSDDDAQKRRQLKTKKQGRNKLRISLAGDGSSGRLRGGPNSDRKRNKLKIDVQSAGGSTGLNVPR